MRHNFEVLDASHTQECSVTDLEREYLGFDYGQLGAALMQLWRLPEVYQQVAAYHLQPKLANEAYRRDVEIIHLAHAVCQNQIPDQRHEIISSISDNNPQLKGLPADIDNIILDEVNAHAESVLSLLWPRGAQTLPFGRRETDR